jgi:NADH-quinone oxidoreductase subunit E
MPKLLSKDFYDRMEKLVPRYPTRVALLLPAFHAAQDEHGWLSPEILAEIAAFIGIHPAQAREVASFYNMYHLEPVGKNFLRICTNVACALRGGEALVTHCKKKYDVDCGQTTGDGKITFIEEECLGACGTAPAVMLNDDYHEKLDVERLDQILNGLR